MSSAWRIEYTPRAQKQLKKIGTAEAVRIVRTLQRELGRHENPRDFGATMMGEWSGYWRYRVGEYRAVCRIENLVVTVFVIEVGHRSSVYR